jgi:hypothetical protein
MVFRCLLADMDSLLSNCGKASIHDHSTGNIQIIEQDKHRGSCLMREQIHC